MPKKKRPFFKKLVRLVLFSKFMWLEAKTSLKSNHLEAALNYSSIFQWNLSIREAAMPSSMSVKLNLQNQTKNASAAWLFAMKGAQLGLCHKSDT